MGGNRLLIAFAVLAVLLAVTVLQFNRRESDDKGEQSVAVKLPKLNKGEIDELVIAEPEKPVVTLKKTDDKWALTQPLAAAADKAAVDGALAKLDELEVVAVAATKPDNYEKLEVDDKHGLLITAKQGGKTLAELLLGAYKGGSTMVREKSGVNVAAVKGSIKYAFDKEIKDWRDRSVNELPSADVKAIEYENPKGKFKFVFEDGAWKQAPGEKALANFDAGKIVSLVGTATTMRAQDFAADDVTEEQAGVGAKPEGLVRITTGGDAGVQQVVLRSGKKVADGANYYLKKEGKDQIFVVSEFSGTRTQPGPDAFQKDAADAKKTGAVGSPGNPIPVYPSGSKTVPAPVAHAHP